MKKRAALLSVLLSAVTFYSISATAGSTQEIFECRSGSGRTTLYAEVPGDHAEHKMTFSIDGSRTTYIDEYTAGTNSSIEVFGAMWDQPTNFHFIVKDTDGNSVFTFLAIPGSIRLKRTVNGRVGTLDAYIVGKVPRKGRISPTISVSCT